MIVVCVLNLIHMRHTSTHGQGVAQGTYNFTSYRQSGVYVQEYNR